jgi:hypothetical protein
VLEAAQPVAANASKDTTQGVCEKAILECAAVTVHPVQIILYVQSLVRLVAEVADLTLISLYQKVQSWVAALK